jgi:hypothetical protein
MSKWTIRARWADAASMACKCLTCSVVLALPGVALGAGSDQKYVGVDEVALRPEPLAAAKSVATLHRNDAVTVTATRGEWCNVQAGAQLGWVRCIHLSAQQTPSARPASNQRGPRTAAEDPSVPPDTSGTSCGKTPWIIGAVVLLLALLGGSRGSARCQRCGNSIRRTYYTWTDEAGTETRVCPECNTRLRRRNSARTF